MSFLRPDPHASRVLPLTVARSEEYAWRAVAAGERGDHVRASHWARMSRIACGIASRIGRLERDGADS